MQRKGTTILAIIVVVLTLGVLWYVDRPVISREAYLGRGSSPSPKRWLPVD